MVTLPRIAAAFLFLAALALSVGGVGAFLPPAPHADAQQIQPSRNPADQVGAQAPARNSQDTPADGAQDTPASKAAQGGAASGGCGLWPGTWVTAPCIDSIFYYITLPVRYLAQFILWLSAYVFDTTVYFVVVKMGALLTDNAGAINPAIQLAWRTFRDLGNILFVFALVFIGIATILGIDRYGYRQMLARVVLAALFINFSLLITSLVIDTANLFAYNIYLVSAGCTEEMIAAGQDTECIEKGISDTFLTQTRISSFFNKDAITNLSQRSETGFLNVSTFLNVMGTILFSVISFVFIAASFMLLSRFIILTFLLITSPLAFAGMVFPFAQGMARKWWEALLRNAFFAPLFLLFVWVAISISSAFFAGFTDPTSSFGALFTQGEGAQVALLVYFSVLIGLFIASLLIAQQIGVYGAKRAVRVTRVIAKGTYAGTAGWMVRSGLGGGAQRLRRWYEKQDLKMAQGVERLREKGRVGRAAAAVAGGALNLAHEGITKGTKAVEKKKFGTFASYEDRRKWVQEQKKQRKEVVATQNKVKAEKELIQAIKFLTAATDRERMALLQMINKKRPAGQQFATIDDFRKEAQSRIQKYQDLPEFAENADAATQKLLAHEAVASIIPKGRFDKIVQNGKIDIATRQSMAQNRIQPLQRRAAAIQNPQALSAAEVRELQSIMRNYAPAEFLKLETAALQKLAEAKLLDDTRTLTAIVRDAASVGNEQKLHAIYQGIARAYGGPHAVPQKLRDYFEKGEGIHYKP